MAHNRQGSTHEDNNASPQLRARESCGEVVFSWCHTSGRLWSHARLSSVRTGSQKDRAATSSAGKIGLQRDCSQRCIHWHTDSTQLSKYQPSRQSLNTAKTFSRITILQIFFFLNSMAKLFLKKTKGKKKKEACTTRSDREKLLLNQDALLPDLAGAALRMCHPSFTASRIQSDS